MSKKDKTTDDSKVELTDEELDGVEGGAVDFFLKLDGVPGESKDNKADSVLGVSRLREATASKTLKGRIGSKTYKL